ncbi:hypothetical protein GWK47_053913 [Chionoecetes opilio]|uniref:Uncharacterized protein n=1 Tax=Chionoecetes opilio TaxID=41210 RepID=A0A8J4Y078_CHIOP|nr:hypothetical protein GWK47_053913 [Chionoecetes opilio]
MAGGHSKLQLPSNGRHFQGGWDLRHHGGPGRATLHIPHRGQQTVALGPLPPPPAAGPSGLGGVFIPWNGGLGCRPRWKQGNLFHCSWRGKPWIQESAGAGQGSDDSRRDAWHRSWGTEPRAAHHPPGGGGCRPVKRAPHCTHHTALAAADTGAGSAQTPGNGKQRTDSWMYLRTANVPKQPRSRTAGT